MTIITVEIRQKKKSIESIEASTVIEDIIREALRAKGLFNGGITGTPINFGRGYAIIFEVESEEVKKE